MPNDAPRISFRPVTDADLPMLGRWMQAPHWREWWGEPDYELGLIRDMVDGRDTARPYIFEVDGEAAGYIQYWFVDDERGGPSAKDNPWLEELPQGTIGVDLSIGEAQDLSKGIGSAALRAFVDDLVGSGHEKIIIDPDPANQRAVKAYTKVGFRPIPSLLGRTKDVLIMQYELNEQV